MDPITHVMTEFGSALYDNLVALDDTGDRRDAVFMSVLARKPNAADRRAAASEFSRTESDGKALGNIAWGLLNTREFLFIQ